MAATTVTGTDSQLNAFSATPGGCGVGIGGPNPISLPANAFPADGIYDPSNPKAQLQLGANPTTPASYDAILKLADGLTGQTLIGVRVAQGHEDSVNLQNGATSLTVKGDFSVSGPAGLRVVTIKGGSSHNVIAGVIHQAGTTGTIRLGDWSDQNYGVSTANDLSGLSMADGSKVSVVLGHTSGTVLGSNCKVDWVASIELKAYWLFKRLVRIVLRVPLGTSGPSWLA